MVVRPGTPDSPRWPGFATLARPCIPLRQRTVSRVPGQEGLPFCGVQGQHATGEVRQERSPATPVPVQRPGPAPAGRNSQDDSPHEPSRDPRQTPQSPREDAISIRCACRRAARSADRCPGSRERRRSVQQARKYARSSVGRSKPSGKENCSAHTCTRVSRVPA